MEFRVLGPLEVVGADGPVALGGAKQRAVLAHLLLRANRVVAIDVLIDVLWGDEPPETARNTLQTYVYRLRKLLGDGRIEGRDGGYVLRAEAREIDASRFEAILREAKSLATSDPGVAVQRFDAALGLWRGPALGDLAEEPSLRGEIARFEELRLSAMERRIAAEIAMGGHSTVVSELEALTAAYPLRERMWANLMLALYRSGRQAEALSTYQRAREVLEQELGTEPSRELRGLHEQILRGDPGLGAPVTTPAPRAVRPSRLDLEAETRFAAYRIERTLGRGGMSTVYLAEHEWLQRKVALKVLAPQLAEDEGFRERFVRESRLAASLDHPNVIPIFEAGESGADLFIAMRYVEGTDLRTLLRERGPMEPERAAAIVRQVAAALDAAHEEGLVHRDVKPANVLLARPRASEAGEHVYLSDFGLTKRSTNESGVTGTGQFVGTLDYAAPEQFHGGSLDARTDVYSLGCVLYECLTGHPPFRAENDAGLMYAHLQERPPVATAVRPELPKAIDAVVTRAMAKAPADRHQTAGDLAEEAARALGLARPPAEAQARPLLRRLIPAAAVALALVAGVLIASALQGGTPPAEGEGSASPTGSPSASPTPAPPAFRTVERPLTSDEERLLTYVPEEVAGECRPLDRAEPIRGEIAALACRGVEVEVLYELFPTRDLMDAAFQVNTNVTRAPDGECATDTLAVTPYTVGGEPAGSVLCYTIDRSDAPGGLLGSGGAPDQSHIEWTDENSSIHAHAVRNDLGDLSLYEWWLASSGPLIPGAARAPKDRPTVSGPRLKHGSYLAAPPGGCAGFEDETCGLHIDGDSYQDSIYPGGPDNESGTLLLQKPNAIVFTPLKGYCMEAAEIGGGGDPRPAVYTWTAKGDRVSFDRISGGQCAGPQKMDGGEPWTVAPEGVIALEQGGSIELIGPGGALVGSTTQPFTYPNSWPDWSPDGERIVFAGAGPGGFDLYLMNEDGSDLHPLTEMPGDEITPDWSPDGSRIAVTFDDGAEIDRRSGIAFVNSDGSGWTEVIARDEERVESPHWSPDGSKIAFTLFTAQGPPFAYVVDADGTGIEKLSDEPAVAIAWTPDGERIVLSSGEALVTVRPDGQGKRVLIPDPPEDGRLVMDWSPDGNWFVASPPSGVGATLYLLRVDGGQVFRIGSGNEPGWRPV